MLDLLVVGAGPAGCAAAITAARAGLDVTVVDKATFPRDKTCGDGLTTGALRGYERLGLDVRSLASYASIRETVVLSPSGRRVSLPFPPDAEFAGVVTRLELDAALVDVVRDRGVAIRQRAELTAVDQCADHVMATFGDGSQVSARSVVAADGHYSAVRRVTAARSGTGGPPQLGRYHAFRQYYRGVDDRRLWVLFEPDLLPGYAWVFPLPGRRANVGFGIERRPGVDGRAIRAAWRGLLQGPRLRAALGEGAEPEGSARAWPIPAWDGRRPLADGRVLFAGDAAAVVDPMSGEGIAQAIDTGVLAARAVAGGGRPESIAARYERGVARDLARDLGLARVLSAVLRSPGRARAALRAVDHNDWTRRNFARWMFEDYPRAVLMTPRRWRPDMLAAVGAYRATAVGRTPGSVRATRRSPSG